MANAQVPQADKLEDVERVVEGIAQGNVTDEQIGRYIGKVERQGRYYRDAAEILGLIETENNRSRLTDAGTELLRLRSNQQDQVKPFLAARVAALPAFDTVLNYIRDNPGSNKRAITEILASLTGNETTAQRRITSVLNWLHDLDMIQETTTGYIVGWKPTVAGMEILGDGLLDTSTPNAPSLRELESIWSGARRPGPAGEADLTAIRQLVAERNADKRAEEAASERHQAIVSSLAQLIRRKGAIPQFNAHIDLYAQVQGIADLFEVKSCNQENLIAQARRGLAQLYEYRYIHRLEDVNLILALEQPPQGSNAWYTDYLVNDRGILVCWFDANDKLACPQACVDKLGHLMS